MEAAGNDYSEIVELLLEEGADQNLQDQVNSLVVLNLCEIVLLYYFEMCSSSGNRVIVSFHVVLLFSSFINI